MDRGFNGLPAVSSSTFPPLSTCRPQVIPTTPSLGEPPWVPDCVSSKAQVESCGRNLPSSRRASPDTGIETLTGIDALEEAEFWLAVPPHPPDAKVATQAHRPSYLGVGR